MNIPTLQKIKSSSQKELYRNNLKNQLILKSANISNKIIESKIKKSEEMYMRAKQRQNRLEIARINSELMRMEKIFKVEMKHMDRNFSNKYRKINQIFNIYDIIKYYNDINYYNLNNRNDFLNKNDDYILNDIKNEYDYKNY